MYTHLCFCYYCFLFGILMIFQLKLGQNMNIMKNYFWIIFIPFKPKVRQVRTSGKSLFR